MNTQEMWAQNGEKKDETKIFMHDMAIEKMNGKWYEILYGWRKAEVR